MKYPVSNLVILLLLSSSGATCRKLPPVENSLQPKAMPVHQQESKGGGLEFKSILSGKAKTGDGSPYSFHLYKSSDDVSISVRFERRGSSTRAKEALHKTVERAFEVLERGPKLDSNGELMGERAVLRLSSKDSDKIQAVVLWNDGSHLYYIESPSLRHALEFEKNFYANQQ